MDNLGIALQAIRRSDPQCRLSDLAVHVSLRIHLLCCFLFSIHLQLSDHYACLLFTTCNVILIRFQSRIEIKGGPFLSDHRFCAKRCPISCARFGTRAFVVKAHIVPFSRTQALSCEPPKPTHYNAPLRLHQRSLLHPRCPRIRPPRQAVRQQRT